MVAVLTEPEAAKAATATAGGDMVFMSFPIEKREETKTVNPVDGTPDIEIWGKATDGTLDSDLQIVDPDWSLSALKTWFDTGGNVRFQHDPQKPIGKGIDVDGHYVRALIAEPTAKHLVRTGVLNDFSVGIMNPDIRRGDPAFKHLDPTGRAVNGVITGRPDGMTRIGEVSAVDRGSNFGTKFSMCKAASDGSPEWVGKLTAPDDVIAKVARPAKNGKTVTVELPANMSLSVKPSDLAKLATFKQKLATQTAAAPAPEPVVAKVAEPDAEKAADVSDPALEAFKAVGAAEDTVLGKESRTFTAEQRREHASAGVALPDGSYPMPDADAVRRAAILIRSKHGKWKAAAKLLGRRVRALGIPNPLKKTPKADKAAAATPDVTKCMKCDGTGMADGKPCPECKPGKRKAAAAEKRRVRKALTAPDAEKKHKVMCPNCGAKQNVKHGYCPECGKPLPRSAPAVVKNHDFACLGCGKDLDKGEKHCPDCGRENPGYLPEADHKIPANKVAGSGKERVANKRKAKGKPGSDGDGKFGGKKAPPFGAKDGDDDGKPAKAEKGKKRKVPDGGVTGNREPATKPVPAHREPDGPPVEAFESGAGMSEAAEMKAAMRHKSLAELGVSREDALLHDLTCPAFSPASVAEALPYASLASLDDGAWRARMLDTAASAPLEHAGKAVMLAQHAATLKTADPGLVAELRGEAHQAFCKANKDTLKAFRDATPGPGTFPTPGHVTPQQFRRPYISAGHASESPVAEGPHTFAVPSGQPSAAEYHRDYISAGHASESPQNEGRSEPIPAPSTPGKPSRVYYTNAMRDNLQQAMRAMHDHIAGIYPDSCPMSPPMGSTQKPAPPVPEGVGGPPPRAKKTAKVAERKAARVLAAKRRELERKVLAGKMTVKQARQKLGLGPVPAKPASVTKAAAAAPAVPVLDAGVVKAAVAEATAPLLERIATRDKAIRKLQKTVDAIASQPDTRHAPMRGVVAKQASAAPAGPLSAAEVAERAQAAHLQLLNHERLTNPDPEQREAARAALLNQMGIGNTPPR